MPRNILPEPARVLPKGGQKLWLRVFNNALDRGESEPSASEEAWAAVKRAGYYRQDSGKWSKIMDFESNFELREDGSFELGVPLIKVDVKKRIVSGFATLNNVDQAGDIVDTEASKEAFANWFGNIREMHQKKAVGKAVDWRMDKYLDPETGEEYDGVWVDAKISKGAEDTWQKVLDGTLAGFSVGGVTHEKERVLTKAGEKTIPAWKITKYSLNELSLVDSPCNRLATISLIKSVDGDTEFGEIIADEDLGKTYNGEDGSFVDLTPAMENVVAALEAWRDEAILNNADETVIEVSRLLSGVRSMKRWEQEMCDMHEAEVAEEEGEAEESYSDKEEDMAEAEMDKMADELQNNEDSVTTGLEELTEEEKGIFRKFVDFVKGETAEKVEEPLSKEGEEMETEELTKAVEAQVTEIRESLEKAADEKFEQIAESLKAIAETLEKVATVEALESVKTELASELEAVNGRVKDIEDSGAIQKSGDDAGKTGEKIEKEEGFWGDSFLPEYALQKG